MDWNNNQGVWNPDTAFSGLTDDDVLQASNIVSGMGITEEADGTSSADLADMLKNFNASNTKAVEAEKRRLIEEERARQEEDNRIKQEQMAKLLQEQSEQERIERERLRKEEEEEERKALAEAEEKRKSNPFFKLKESASLFSKDFADTRAAKNEEKKRASEQKKAEMEQKRAEAATQRKAEAEQKAQAMEVETAAKKEAAAKKEPAPKKRPAAQKPPKQKPSTKEKGRPSTEKEAKPDYEYLATHDNMTGMKNCTAYDLAIKQCSPNQLAILFFDIDGLKYTNDNLGHEQGDKLICAVASAISDAFPDCSYRIGSDEFIVLYKGKNLEELQRNATHKISKIQSALSQKTKKEPEGISYSVSAGVAVGDGKKSVSEIREEAYKAMCAKKEAKKEKQTKQKSAGAASEKDYDALLSKEQQTLKGVIKDNHVQASEEATEKIILEIQRRCNEVIAVLVASPTYDHLFILQNVENFIDMVAEMDSLVDYSYLYVVYENGTQFYGIDEYLDEVTVLFSEIGKTIKTSQYVTEKELLKIKGINIFKNIYID